jgi:hypothetical protein
MAFALCGPSSLLTVTVVAIVFIAGLAVVALKVWLNKIPRPLKLLRIRLRPPPLELEVLHHYP